MNTVFTTIKERRTVHFYEAKKLPEHLLKRALEVAIFAPNHKLSNPWRFILIGEKTREKITDIAIFLKGRQYDLSETALSKIRRKVGSSPEMLIVVQELSENPDRRKEDYAACACVIQNLSLALWSEGVGSKWSTGGFTRSDELYALLDIDRDHQEIIGAVFVGYAEKVNSSARRPLDELLSTTP